MFLHEVEHWQYMRFKYQIGVISKFPRMQDQGNAKQFQM